MWHCGDGTNAVNHDGQAPRVVEGYTVSHDTFRRLLVSSWSARPERLQNGRLRPRALLGVTQFKLLAEKHAATGRVNRENGCSHLILAQVEVVPLKETAEGRQSVQL